MQHRNSILSVRTQFASFVFWSLVTNVENFLSKTQAERADTMNESSLSDGVAQVCVPMIAYFSSWALGIPPCGTPAFNFAVSIKTVCAQRRLSIKNNLNSDI